MAIPWPYPSPKALIPARGRFIQEGLQDIPRGLSGAVRRCSACAARVSEEIKVGDLYAMSRHCLDHQTAQASNGPPWAAQETLMTTKTGTSNVLCDLDLEDAADLTARAQLAIKLNDLIDQRGLTQAEVTALTGMTQPKISQIRHYKLRNISLERLMRALVSLDQHVEIRVRKTRQSDATGITVAAEGRPCQKRRVTPVSPCPSYCTDLPRPAVRVRMRRDSIP